MAGESLIEIRNQRLQKVQKLRDMGIDPYPAKSNRDTFARQILEDYENFADKTVVVAGRLMSWREHGQLVFGHIQDSTARVQLYIREDGIKKEASALGFADLNLLDVGDLVEATGTVTKTQRGEVSILVEKLKILTKSIRPLPDKWSGLKDSEALFRQRYLDTIMNPDHRFRFEKMSQIIFAIREFLFSKGFLEIKTPILQPLYGGGLAKPFKTHVNALDVDYYMAISHELYLKRLITAGFENVFNIVGYFRNEGIDRTHNPEFTMLETMSAFKNYEDNMNLIEEMYLHIAKKVFNKTVFKVNGQEIDFSKPWERITMLDAVKKYAGYDFNEVKTLEQAHKILDEIGYAKTKPNSIGESMSELFKEKGEVHLQHPTFLTGHPVEISPLAKRRSDDPRFVERFEIFIGGIEGGDNWTELNDPVELFNRFKEQIDRRKGGDEEAHPMDIEFIEMMEYGMPPTTGLGPGLERLTMMLTETEYIDDVLFFPLLKPAAITETQKAIYGEEYLAPTSNKSSEKTQDFSKKLVIVVDESLEQWQVLNTIAHVSAYIGNKLDGKFATGANFVTQDGKDHPRNSQYPIVALKAKSSKLQALMQEVRESGLLYHGFIREMIETTDDAKITEMLKSKEDKDIEYLGIGIFGDNEEVSKLTKKFSLWK